MKLRELAHSRTGDKGDHSNVSVIVYRLEDYSLIERHLTTERIRTHLRGRVRGEVTRYCLPMLGAINFVLHDALTGGVTRSLALDPHGKCISGLLLDLELPVEAPGQRRRAAR
jgi:hypothetical protein